MGLCEAPSATQGAGTLWEPRWSPDPGGPLLSATLGVGVPVYKPGGSSVFLQDRRGLPAESLIVVRIPEAQVPPSRRGTSHGQLYAALDRVSAGRDATILPGAWPEQDRVCPEAPGTAGRLPSLGIPDTSLLLSRPRTFGGQGRGSRGHLT